MLVRRLQPCRSRLEQFAPGDITGPKGLAPLGYRAPGSVFVVLPNRSRAQTGHVVILNDAAWSIVQAQRGLHPIWVFPFRGQRIASMNNTGWQNARRDMGLERMRRCIHSEACRAIRVSCG
jgi:hypothetical protein